MSPPPSPTDDAPTPRVRWFHLLALGICLLIGGGFRFHRITHESLWLDEYTTVYLATARAQPGQALLDTPFGVLFPQPPAIDYRGAPPWWKIWTGLGPTTHPPLHFILLRWWIDLFGEGDLSTRTLSTLFDLGAAVVLFEILRRTQGPWQGVIAAGLLCFSCAQLDQSQQDRSYTFLVFVGLLTCLSLVNIERKDATRWRLTGLALLTWATAMTHYFSAGALLGLGFYASLRLQGQERKKVFAAFAAALFAVAVTWGPFFWLYRGGLTRYDLLDAAPGQGLKYILSLLISQPARFVLHPDLTSGLAVYAVAILVYLFPIANFRRTRDGLLWWLWMMGSIGFVAVLDIFRHTQSLSLVRYTFLASPAIYALLATPLPIRGFRRWLIPGTMLFCAFCFATNRAINGPPPTPLIREMAAAINQLTAPNDVIVFTPAGQFFPQMAYLQVRHYSPDFPHPVVFLLRDPPGPAAMQFLAQQPRFWMLGTDAAAEMPVYFPQWKFDLCRPMPPIMLWRVIPTAPASTSPEPSPATRP